MKYFTLRNSIIFSVCLHILIAGALLIAEQFKNSQTPPQVVTVDFISPEEAQRRMQEPLAQQIVEQDEKNANDIEPEKAKYLSAKNQKVEKETVAKNRGEFQNRKQTATALSQAPGKAGQQQAQASQSETRKGPPQVKDLFAGYNASESYERQKNQVQRQAKTQTGNSVNPGQTGEVSQTNDYLKDLEQGVETLVNAREFKYYSYYSRIRRQLSQHWQSKVSEKMSKLFKEGRSPAAAGQDRITKVVVVLNAAGSLVGVQVLSDSGVRDLDEAAVEAFRAAAPFPNPPKGIVEEDGTVKIRWDFILES